MCIEECEYILISWWKTMLKGDLIEYYKYKCKKCGNEKIDPPF
jgi:hypothetical protein